MANPVRIKRINGAVIVLSISKLPILSISVFSWNTSASISAGASCAAARQAYAAPIHAIHVLNGAQMEAIRAVLRHPQLDAAFKALALTLPAESDIAEHMASQGLPVDPQRIHATRQAMLAQIASALQAD